jgi:hypothetical protein
MGYCMAIDHDTRASMSPQRPPQDGRWAIFAPASYKNMALGEAQLPRLAITSAGAWIGRRGGAFEKGPWGYNAARARCSEAVPQQ